MNQKRINLKQFQKHEKKFPWALIRKIVIVALMIGLLIYVSKSAEKKSTSAPNSNVIELEIED